MELTGGATYVQGECEICSRNCSAHSIRRYTFIVYYVLLPWKRGGGHRYGDTILWVGILLDTLANGSTTYDKGQESRSSEGSGDCLQIFGYMPAL